MGISGLLGALNSIVVDSHIKEFEGKTVGIDIYCWLHKAAYSCPIEIVQNLPTDKYVRYCVKRIRLLQQYNVKPLIVFDGGPLPMKEQTALERRVMRETHKEKGLELLKQGDINGAKESFQKAIEITKTMVYTLIKVFRELNIDFIVAPYEADAQLAFLSLNNYIACIITEDSDLLAYGCAAVFFKMDELGNGKMIKIENLGATKNPSFLHFTLPMFRQVCILSGCDYLDSIPGLGLKTAHALIKKYKTVLAYLSTQSKYSIPKDYALHFAKAELTFLHQRVYDPSSKRLVTLTPLPDGFPFPNTDFLGPDIPPEVMVNIANGYLDPYSKLPYEQLLPASTALTPSVTSSTPSQLTGYLQGGNSTELHTVRASKSTAAAVRSVSALPSELSLKKSAASLLPVQKNVISNYFTPVTKATKKPFMLPRAKSSPDNINNTPLLPSPQQLHFPIDDVDEEEHVSQRVKRHKGEVLLLAPRTPSPPPTPPHHSTAATAASTPIAPSAATSTTTTTIIVSKYFPKKSVREQKALQPVKRESMKIPTFSSPLINNSERLSLLKSSNERLSLNSPNSERLSLNTNNSERLSLSTNSLSNHSVATNHADSNSSSDILEVFDSSDEDVEKAAPIEIIISDEEVIVSDEESVLIQ